MFIVAIESRASTSTERSPETVIENEIPTYRALSPWAVGSLVAGLVSILSFAEPTFLLAAIAAVLFGSRALVKLRQQPDLFTGKGLAQAGMVLGLVCGLSSVTMGYVQRMLLNRRAEAFVQGDLIKVLKDGDVDAALWYRLEPETRGSMSPEQVRQTFVNPKSPDPLLLNSEMTPVRRICDAVGKEGAELRFARIERTDWDGVTPIVLGVLEIISPEHEEPEGNAQEHADHKHGPQYAAVILKSKRDGSRESWWVDKYIFPYRPNTYVEEMKPVDDGHGHAH